MLVFNDDYNSIHQNKLNSRFYKIPNNFPFLFQLKILQNHTFTALPLFIASPHQPVPNSSNEPNINQSPGKRVSLVARQRVDEEDRCELVARMYEHHVPIVQIGLRIGSQ